MSPVQATVERWVPGVGGTALRDDGTVLQLPPDCLIGGPFRFLRLGQRVSLTVDEQGVARSVDLP